MKAIIRISAERLTLLLLQLLLRERPENGLASCKGLLLRQGKNEPAILVIQAPLQEKA